MRVLAALLELCGPGTASPLLNPAAEAPRSQLEAYVHGLERQARSFTRSTRRSNVAEVLGRLASVVPNAVLDRAMALFDASSGDEDRDRMTRMALLDALGHAVKVDLLRHVVPLLYTALLHEDAAVRSAAIDLWVACSRAADRRLPAELSALASTLLADEHVVVHRAMLRALPELDVPDEDLRQVLDLTAGWARTYAGRDPDVVDHACGSLLSLAARLDDADLVLVVRATVIDLAEHLDPQDREHVLLAHSLDSLRASRLWAQRALETLGEPVLGDRFNARDEPLLDALLVEPLGLRQVDRAVAERVTDLHLPDFAGRAEEIVELLQAAGLWDDAAILARHVHAQMPDTTEHVGRRRLTRLVDASAELEAAVAGLTSFDAAAASASVERHRRYDDAITAVRTALSEVTVESASAHLARFVQYLQARLDTLVALTVRPAVDAAELATRLETAADPIRTSAIEQSWRVGDNVRRAYAGALSVAAHLRRFDAAIRGADAAASDLHRAAAHRTADVLASALDRPQLVPVSLSAFAQTARSLDEAAQIDAACGLLALTPIPLPLVNLPARSSRLGPRPRPDDAGEGERGVPLAVTVLAIDDTPLTDVAVLRPGYVYDLGIDLRLEVWPDWADRCEVQLLSTLPPDALVLPAFRFTREALQTDANGARLAATGTLRCTVEQRTNRPPLDCPVLVRFTGPDHAEHADVAGYTRLRMRPFDPSRDALTEHAQVDERLLRLFDPLHDDATLDPDDVQAFCRLFAACVRAAQRIMFDRAFRRGTRVTEAQFHDELERHLRADPELGGRLTRRDAVAGGFDDLLHDDVIAELKVERTTPVTVAHCARYLGQPVQYGVDRGSRLSVLVVLDHSRKKAPPGVLENYIDWLLPAHHGLDDPRYPSRVGVLIINTNLPVPSAWSRRAIATRDSETS